MLRLGILASGQLGYQTLKILLKKYSVEFILTDKKSKQIIAEATQKNIKCFVGNPRNGKGYNFIKTIRIDVLISINYLFIIEDDIISHANKLSFNLHGSLLPKYRGRTPHVWAIINNEKTTGVTAHIIEKECDAGAILEQIIIPISETDTGQDLLMKYEKEYPIIIDKVLHKLQNHKLDFRKQDETKATYFGKRTPEEGRINWSWHKERIYNWVRAQAFPYPGAFTFVNNKRFIIDKVSFSDLGFDFKDENGRILQTKPNLIVKTPNGAVKIERIRHFSEISDELFVGGKLE